MLLCYVRAHGKRSEFTLDDVTRAIALVKRSRRLFINTLCVHMDNQVLPLQSDAVVRVIFVCSIVISLSTASTAVVDTTKFGINMPLNILQLLCKVESFFCFVFYLDLNRNKWDIDGMASY